MSKLVFDLQRFSDDSDGYSVDEALAVINGTNEQLAEQEQANEKTASTEVGAEEQGKAAEQQQEQDEQPKQVAEEQPKAADFNQVIEYKENGQTVKKTLAEIIADAQKGANYDRHMQDLKAKQQAYEASLQQQNKPNYDPAKTFEELNNKVTARAMEMLGITDPSEFEPDAMGIMGSKIHYAAYQKALLDVQQEQHSEQAQFQEYKAQEERYATLIDGNWKDPDVEKINEHAINSFYALPSKGPEGIAEFNRLYPIYQKIQQRDEYWRGNTNVRIDPFTAKELDAIEKFMNNAKADYRAKQTKEQIKGQVPKSVPIKPTVKVEGAGNNESAPSKKLDMNKIRSMDIDEIAKLL